MNDILHHDLQNGPCVQHLSDEQFAGLLFGTSTAEATSHLATCAQCAEEAVRVSGSIESFECDSRLWAERHAAAMPAVYPARQPIPSWLQIPAAWAVAAVALVIATTISLPHFGDHGASVVQSSETVAAAAQPVVTEVPPATLKSDNALLSAIDGKLRASDTPPAQFYGLQEDAPSDRVSRSHEVAD